METLDQSSDEDNWNEFYQYVKKYVEIHKYFPQHNDRFNVKYVKWIKKQQYYKLLNKLSDKHIKLLEQIYDWSWTIVDDWYKHYIELKKFIDRYNRLPLKKVNSSEYKLGKWCTNQRTYKKLNKLTDYKIILLEQINNWEWIKHISWDNSYKFVRDFVKRYNKLPSRYSKDKLEMRYGKWLFKQKYNKLSEKQTQLLKEIGL